jgi:hypothetical protein
MVARRRKLELEYALDCCGGREALVRTVADHFNLRDQAVSFTEVFLAAHSPAYDRPQSADLFSGTVGLGER